MILYNLIVSNGVTERPIESYKRYTVGKLKEILAEEWNCTVQQILLFTDEDFTNEMYDHIEICEYLNDGDKFYIFIEDF